MGARKRIPRLRNCGENEHFQSLIDLDPPACLRDAASILVLCHFLMRTRLVIGRRLLPICSLSVGLPGMLATPWLVRILSIKFAPMMLVSVISLAVAAIVLVFVPSGYVDFTRARARHRKVSCQDPFAVRCRLEFFNHEEHEEHEDYKIYKSSCSSSLFSSLLWHIIHWE